MFATALYVGRPYFNFALSRMQPLTRGPEADEANSLSGRTATTRVRAAVKTAAAPCSAFDLCRCKALSSVRSSPLGADMVCKSRNSFGDALFTQGLMALIQPTICCVRAQSAREFVTEFSGGATPHRSGVAQS